MRDFVATFGIETFPSKEALSTYQKAELEKWGKAVRDAGLYGTL